MMRTIHTPQAGREWLRRLKARGADGVKFFGAPPAIMQAALEESLELGCAPPATMRRWRSAG